MPILLLSLRQRNQFFLIQVISTICLRGWEKLTCRSELRTFDFVVGRSSNGKTADSGSAYRGSNPCLPAKRIRNEFAGGAVTARRCFFIFLITS